MSSAFNHVCKDPFAIFTGLGFQDMNIFVGPLSFPLAPFQWKPGKQVCSFRIQRDYRKEKEAQNYSPNSSLTLYNILDGYLEESQIIQIPSVIKHTHK